MGERITPNAARMKGVPKKLKEKVSITVRGEIILKLSDMERAFPDASNPRNQAAGTSKRFDGSGCEHLTVLFYDLDGEAQFVTPAGDLRTLPSHWADLGGLDGFYACRLRRTA